MSTNDVPNFTSNSNCSKGNVKWIDKIGRFYMPTKLPTKNLSCVMQKSGNFVG